MYVHAPLSFTIGKGNRELDPKLYDFMSFLGLIEEDAKGADWNFGRKIGEKIERLYLYGKVKSDSDDHEKIKKEVYNLKRKVGVNWTGKTLVDELWQHTMLDTGFNRQLKTLSKKPVKKVVEEKKEDLRSKVAGPEPIKEVKYKKPKEEEPLKFKERPRGELKSEPIEI